MIKRPAGKTINLLITLSLFLVLFNSGALAQEKRIDSLRNDFKLFRNLLTNDYPSLYRYSSTSSMDSLLDCKYNLIGAGTTNLEFYKLLKSVLSKVKDGHLYCSLPPELEKYREEKGKFFPLHLYFSGDRAYVTESFGSSIPAGAELISINKQSINSIREQAFDYLPADGVIKTKKYRILNDYFYFYYNLLYGERPYFNVKFKLAGSKAVKEVRIEAKLEKDVVKKEIDEAKPLQLIIKPNGVAILTIKTFNRSVLATAGLEFPEFLEKSFEEINRKKIRKVILDLRGNGGGRDTYGMLLYSYLTNRKFRYYSRLETVTSKLPYEQFESKSSSFNDLNESMLLPDGSGRFELKDNAHLGLQFIQPAETYYSGRIWFLIDGLSFSTTAEFCAIASENRRGEFIGEETGGACGGNTSGGEFEIVLPATKISVSAGCVEYKMSVHQKRLLAGGVMPDYQVVPGINDIINKKDVQLNYALKVAGLIYKDSIIW